MYLSHFPGTTSCAAFFCAVKLHNRVPAKEGFFSDTLHKKDRISPRTHGLDLPPTGLEPVRYFYRGILSLSTDLAIQRILRQTMVVFTLDLWAFEGIDGTKFFIFNCLEKMQIFMVLVEKW